ncbi:MAG: MlaD family protein [Paracoccaceae bacterium]
MTEEAVPVEPDVERKRGRLPSIVWLVPLAAVAAAVALLVQNLSSRGPLIEIEFRTASGMAEGRTPVRYRDLDVGQVEALRFSEDLTRVVAEVRMTAEVAPYLDEEARFWVVAPQISAQGISGLETVLSGSYIQGSWDNEPGERQSSFVALQDPPLTPEGTPGASVQLRAEQGGSLDIGSPIFFKGVQVGQVESKRLTEDGEAVEFDVFVNAPHNQRVSTATRFWDVSGVQVSIGAEGAQLEIASLASVIRGGAAFATLGAETPEPVEDGHTYTLYPSRQAAQEDVVVGDLDGQARVAVLFDASVRGLRPGAEVDIAGLRVGRVVEVRAEIVPETGRYGTRTVLALSPSRLGVEDDDAAVIDFLENAVANGLRARLAMSNLLTGTLYVELVELDPDALVDPNAAFDRSGEIPVIPSVPSDVDRLSGSVAGLLDRVDSLPIETLLDNAARLLENVNAVMASEATRAIPDRALAVLDTAEALVADPAIGETVAEARALAASLRGLAESEAVQAAPVEVRQLLAALGARVETLRDEDAAADLAGLVAALRARAEDPALASLPNEAAETLAAARALLADPALGEVPASANAALESLRATLDDPALRRLPGEAEATLASLRARLDDPALAEAAAALAPLLTEARGTIATLGSSADPALAAITEILASEATRRLPVEVAATLGAVRALAETPALGETPAAINATLETLRATLSQPEVRALPGEAGAALAALQARLDDPALGEAIAAAAPLLTEARETIDALGRGADPALGALTTILEQEGARALPGELSATLATARRFVEDGALDETLGETNATLASLRALLEQPSTRAAPEELAATLAAARALLTTLEREEAAAELAATLQATRDLVASPSLKTLSDELAATVASLRGLLQAPGAERLPAATAEALDEAAKLAEQFREENIGRAASAALSGVETASASLERAASRLPALLDRLAGVASRADDVLASVSVGSELNYEAVAAIRDIREAARAVTDVAELVERNPNSIILGK